MIHLILARSSFDGRYHAAHILRTSPQHCIIVSGSFDINRIEGVPSQHLALHLATGYQQIRSIDEIWAVLVHRARRGGETVDDMIRRGKESE